MCERFGMDPTQFTPVAESGIVLTGEMALSEDREKAQRKVQKVHPNKFDIPKLMERQALPLEDKIDMSHQRIIEWYEHHDGMVYVAFSGGKDSTVLLDMVREIYPDVPAVFADTGLEYPEIRKFVKTVDNVIWVKPKMKFRAVVETYGFPIISKKVCHQVQVLQNPTPTNVNSRRLYLHGIKRDGTTSRYFKLPRKWLPMVDSPFRFSDKCCDIIKKEPLDTYAKLNKRHPFMGTMAADSEQRRAVYLKSGCNVFESGKPKSMPMGFWLEEDVWEYLKKYKVPYSKIYDLGEKRTGRMFCGFGIHMQGEPNRFVRMKKSHPAQWRYCMDKLGMRELLQFFKIPTGDDDES